MGRNDFCDRFVSAGRAKMCANTVPICKRRQALSLDGRYGVPRCPDGLLGGPRPPVGVASAARLPLLVVAPCSTHTAKTWQKFSRLMNSTNLAKVAPGSRSRVTVPRDVAATPQSAAPSPRPRFRMRRPRRTPGTAFEPPRSELSHLVPPPHRRAPPMLAARTVRQMRASRRKLWHAGSGCGRGDVAGGEGSRHL